MKKSIQIISITLAILFGNLSFGQLDSVFLGKRDSVTFFQTNNSSTVIKTSTITDLDKNTYKTVKIGTQEWMVGNLRTTRYSDGTPIPNIRDSAQWSNLITGGWSHYDNDIQYESTYGKLYNWYAVNTNKLCPNGWHVPTDAEWLVRSSGRWPLQRW